MTTASNLRDIQSADTSTVTIIRASAGSGKTYQLAVRILKLLALGIKPDEILATSFTKKAAGEIYDRVISLLRRIAEGETLDSVSLTANEAASILDTLLTSATSLQVTTLDAWYSRIAQRFSAELGLPASWGILSETARVQQLLQAIQSVLRTVGTKDVSVIIRALTHEESPKSVTPILLETFSKLSQVAHITTPESWRWLAGEYQITDVAALVAHIQKMEAPKTKTNTPNKNWQNAIQKLANTVKGRAWKEFFKDGFVNKFIDAQEYYKIPFSEPNAQLMHQAIASAAEELKRLFSQQLSVALLGIGIFEQALTAEESKGQVSFERIKVILSRYIKTAFGDTLRYRLDHRTRHVLFDEFQDTSWTDWAVLEPFISETLSQQDQERSLFVVGDTKQAIYAWRGGTKALFQTIENLAAGQLNAIPLSVSRRSAQSIIGFVNSVFNNLSRTTLSTAVANDFAEHWIEHTTTKSEIGFATVISAAEDANDNNNYTACELQAAQKLAACIAAHPNASVGILFRSNKDVSSFSKLLTERGITHSAEGGTPLLRRFLVQVLEATLRNLIDPSDSIGSHLAMHCGIDAQLLMTTFSTSGLRSAVALCISQMSPLATADEQACFAFIRRQLALNTFTIQDFLIELTGWRLEQPGQSHVRLLTMHGSKGLEFDFCFLPSLNMNLRMQGADANLWLYREKPTSPPSRVSFSFPRALLNVDPTFAEIYSQQENEEMREALNVLYVALTRAKSALYCFIPEKPASTSFAEVIARACTQKEFGDESKLSFPVSHKANAAALDSPLPLSFPIKTKESQKPAEKVTATDSKKVISAESQDGSLQHVVFAKVQFLDDQPVSQLEKALGNVHTCGPASYDAAMTFLKSDFAQKALSRSRYQLDSQQELTVLNEKKLMLSSGDTLLSGVIDRLVLVSQNYSIVAAEILDFKTTPSSTVTSPETLQAYTQQLQLYRKIVSQTFKINQEKIRCTILFTNRLQELAV